MPTVEVKEAHVGYSRETPDLLDPPGSQGDGIWLSEWIAMKIGFTELETPLFKVSDTIMQLRGYCIPDAPKGTITWAEIRARQGVYEENFANYIARTKLQFFDFWRHKGRRLKWSKREDFRS